MYAHLNVPLVAVMPLVYSLFIYIGARLLAAVVGIFSHQAPEENKYPRDS